MSVFSDAFCAYYVKSGQTMQSIAKSVGLSANYLTKMKQGLRLTSEQDKIQQLANSLCLTPSETTDFIQKYNISRIGEEQYQKYMAVRELLSSIHTEETETVRASVQVELPKSCTVRGLKNVARLVQVVLADGLAAKKPVGILAQPTDDIIIHTLEIILQKNINTVVEHLFCLQNEEISGAGVYNISCFQYVIPLAIQSEAYHPMYFYEHVGSHLNEMSLLPYLIITQHSALCLSYDYSRAILYTEPHTVAFYQQEFELCKNKCIPALDRLTAGEYAMHALQQLQEPAACGNVQSSQSIEYGPCIGVAATLDDASTVLRNIEPARQKAYLVMFQKYLQSVKMWTQLWNHEDPLWVTFFSEEGLNCFVQQGVWTQSMAGLIPPVPQRLRASLLKRILEMTKLGVYLPLMLNPNRLAVDPQLVCDSYSENLLLFDYNRMEKTCIFSVSEPSISSIVRRFLEYLPDSDMVYSKEKTLSCLEQAYNAARNLNKMNR